MLTATAASGSPHSGRIAGLDGLRGLAVAAVLGYHLWPGTVPGGFLGVSAFFALSGFLITGRLLAEADRTGRISLGAFWGRRIRRLWPASLAVLAAVLVTWHAAGWLDPSLRRDVLAALGHLANWEQVLAAERYGHSPESSPLLHFWSLAIEEQCYVVLALVAAVTAGSRRLLGAALGLALLASLGATWWWAGDAVTVYFSTATRSAELLAGAVLAVVAHGAARDRAGAALRRWWGALALAALGALGWAALATSVDHPAYASGGLAAAGAVAAVGALAVSLSPGLGRALDVAPLAWLGRVSYGAYLLHWPLLVAATRAGWSGPLVPWLVLAATLVLAGASARFLELPIRERRWILPRPAVVGVPAALLMAVGAVMLPAGRHVVVEPSTAGELAIPDPRLVARPAATRPVGTPSAEPAEPTAPEPIPFAVVGDSAAHRLAFAMAPPGHPDAWLTGHLTVFGCPLGRGGQMADHVGVGLPYELPEECDWTDRLVPAVTEHGMPQAVLVQWGTWDARNRRVPALGSDWRTLGDPTYDEWLLGEMRAFTELLTAAGVRDVAWLTVPADAGYGHPERYARWAELLHLHAAEVPGATVIDLAGWLAGRADLADLLPDSIHLSVEPDGGGARLAGEELVLPALQDLVAARS